MPSKSKAQERLMRGAATNPSFAKKVGVPQSVAREFAAADAGKHKVRRAMTKLGDRPK